MECQSSDSKKIFKVFDASTKHKRTRKKRDGLDDTNSYATDDSASLVYLTQVGRAGASVKVSLQDVPTAQTVAAADNDGKRDRDSSPSVSRSPARGDRRLCRSPRRHRRSIKDGLSLALKSGLMSTPRSSSPRQNADGVIDSIPKDQDSFIYAFLEEAIKKDKRKQRHGRRHEEGRHSDDRRREPSRSCDGHRHHHRRRDDVASKERARDKARSRKEENSPTINQNMLYETFAKLCAQLNEKTNACINAPVPRTLSHKSLQCEVVSRLEANDVDHQPVRLRSNDHSPGNVSKIRSHEDFRSKPHNHEKFPINQHPDKQDKCMCCYDKGPNPNYYSSKMNVTNSRMRNMADCTDRYHSYPEHNMPSRSNLENCYRSRGTEQRDYRNYDRDYVPERNYENDKRRYYDQKTSRSYDIRREGYQDDDKGYRRTARSDNIKEKHYDLRDKYYDEKIDVLERDRYVPSKERRVKRNIEKCDRNSVVSRDDDLRDRYSERERDSGLSVADGETSTISGKSNYLRVVKQEIAEQRETMDKMMKLWKELMRCFKGLSTQNHNKSVQDSAANVQESAVAQLRLWRECMHRYETVARDVGDTDARLMEEINKQRSEMAEMAGMWQECLQRYREMSSDFNNLKQQVNVTKQQLAPENPTRQAPSVPLTCAEGEGSVPPAHYRLPHHYPQMPLMGGGGGYHPGGSPLRSRASAPPAWWWCGERGSPRRRSSPESRGSRERRHRHKERDRDDSRYKEKSSKPSGARSEHKHRKR